jgi:predicted DNA-binding transcriptional regulator AlpA
MQRPEHVHRPSHLPEQPHGHTTPLLLTAASPAAICGKSARTWRTWHALGLIPRPVRIGRSTLWRADELHAWIAAGCPRRQEWEKSRDI